MRDFAGIFAPVGADACDGRSWARTSDLRLVDSTWGVNYVGLRGRNLVFMRVFGLLADLADA
jgi:hypothetical protein